MLTSIHSICCIFPLIWNFLRMAHKNFKQKREIVPKIDKNMQKMAFVLRTSKCAEWCFLFDLWWNVPLNRPQISSANKLLVNRSMQFVIEHLFHSISEEILKCDDYARFHVSESIWITNQSSSDHRVTSMSNAEGLYVFAVTKTKFSCETLKQQTLLPIKILSSMVWHSARFENCV